MKNWLTKFHIKDALIHLPQLRLIGSREIDNISYRAVEQRSEVYCAFQYTIKGTGFFSYGGERWLVPPGKGFFFNTADSGWSYGCTEEFPEPWHFIYIEFSGDTMLALQRELQKKRGFIFNLSINRPILQKFLLFRDSQWSTQTISSAKSAELVFALITELCQVDDSQEHNQSQQLIKKAIDIIAQNLGSSLNVEGLARSLNVSREHLSRVFRQTLNLSPRDYIRQEKIDYACQLLKYNDLNIRKIAECCGYSSDIAFNRSFKAEKGMTPGKFRRLLIN